MLYRITHSHTEIRDNNGKYIEMKPVIKEFTNAKEANAFIQNFLNKECYGIACIRNISDKFIDIYFDIV